MADEINTEETLNNERNNEEQLNRKEADENQQSDQEPLQESLDALNQELERAKAAQNTLKEELLRAQAEMQNIRRRSQRDVEQAHKFALEKFVNELLPVIDGLERGLEMIPEEDEAQKVAREGMGLTLKMFLEALRKHKVEQVYPLGESFNPDSHQAMSIQESAETEPNTVLAVMQKGYTLNSRLVRPALVVVSKAVTEQVINNQ